MPISEQDRRFIEELLADELEYDMLEQLDKKLLDPSFKAAYEAALDAKYKSKKGKLRGYLPMLVLLALIAIGLYLIYFQH